MGLKNIRGNSLPDLLSLKVRSKRHLVELLRGFPRTSCLTKEAQQLRKGSGTGSYCLVGTTLLHKQMGHLRKDCHLRAEVPGHSTQAANIEAAEVTRNAEDLTEAQLEKLLAKR